MNDHGDNTWCRFCGKQPTITPLWTCGVKKCGEYVNAEALGMTPEQWDDADLMGSTRQAENVAKIVKGLKPSRSFRDDLGPAIVQALA
jgi:hypothetical protein